MIGTSAIPSSTTTCSRFYLDNLSSLIHYYRFDPTDIQGTTVLNYATRTYDGTLISGATITSDNETYVVGSGALQLTASNADPSSHFCITNGVLLGNTGLTFAIWFVLYKLNLILNITLNIIKYLLGLNHQVQETGLEYSILVMELILIVFMSLLIGIMLINYLMS